MNLVYFSGESALRVVIDKGFNSVLYSSLHFGIILLVAVVAMLFVVSHREKRIIQLLSNMGEPCKKQQGVNVEKVNGNCKGDNISEQEPENKIEQGKFNKGNLVVCKDDGKQYRVDDVDGDCIICRRGLITERIDIDKLEHFNQFNVRTK